MQRPTTLLASLLSAALLAGACGDDTEGGTGGGGGGTTASSTTAGQASSSSAATTATSSGAGASSSTGSGGGDGGGGAGGGSGGSGGGGGNPACADVIPPQPEPPDLLSETGLYADLATEAVDPRVRAFAPRFPLWSDGAEKARWVYLPVCTTVDITEPDHWQLPVGARLFKEFRVGGLRIETRVVHRFGPGEDDWWMTAYQWEPDFSDAVRVPDGVVDASGTGHDIPSDGSCVRCHSETVERTLGFGAIQLAHAGLGEDDLTLDRLAAEGWLSAAPPAIAIPAADEVELAAIGYLHANCGNCHHEDGLFFPTPFDLRISVLATERDQLGVVQTAIDVPPDSFFGGGVTHRILSGDPSLSAVSYRLGVRPGMPPLGTEIVDVDGKAAVDAWITALP